MHRFVNIKLVYLTYLRVSLCESSSIVLVFLNVSEFESVLSNIIMFVVYEMRILNCDNLIIERALGHSDWHVISPMKVISSV